MIYYNNKEINDWYFGASDISMVYKNGIAFYRKIGNKPATPKKFQATYSGGGTYSENCDDDTTLTSATTKPNGYEYSAMTSAVIGDCIYQLDVGVFSVCTSLTSVTIPNSVTNFANSAFTRCTNLENITLPNSLLGIGNDSFQSCISLRRINSDVDGVFNIPNTVDYIGDDAFSYINNVRNIIYTSSLNYITVGNYAFRNCNHLENITLPLNASIISIGSGTFRYCISLTNVELPIHLKSISDSMFEGAGITGITIPNEVTSIGSYAFYGCSGLTNVVVPNNVTNIGAGAFTKCSNLSGITIGNKVATIDNNAFSGCTSITSITIPSSVTKINANAFGGCSSLQEVHFQGTTPPTIASDAFANCSNLKHIYIPNCQYADAYAATDGLKGGLYEYIYAEDSTHCEVTPPAHDYSQDYFTVVSESADTIVKISGSTTAMTFQMSTNGGTTWNVAKQVQSTIRLPIGTKVLFRSSKTLSPSSSAKGVGKISITGACSVEGNVLSLMYGSSFVGKTTMQGTYCFYALFNGCGVKLLSVENLVLPTTALRARCYEQMFYGCSKIEKAPILPATTLTNYCYQQMFYNCSSLSYIKAMFTTTPSTTYTSNWVYGVKSSGTFVKSSSATWNVTGVNGVPSGWTIQRESS